MPHCQHVGFPSYCSFFSFFPRQFSVQRGARQTTKSLCRYRSSRAETSVCAVYACTKRWALGLQAGMLQRTWIILEVSEVGRGQILCRFSCVSCWLRVRERYEGSLSCDCKVKPEYNEVQSHTKMASLYYPKIR